MVSNKFCGNLTFYNFYNLQRASHTTHTTHIIRATRHPCQHATRATHAGTLLTLACYPSHPRCYVTLVSTPLTLTTQEVWFAYLMQPIFQTEQNVTKYLELETFEKKCLISIIS